MRRTIETLEPRTLLSTYVINGGAGADIWQFEARPGRDQSALRPREMLIDLIA